MPKIDLFNKTADFDKIESAIDDGTFTFRSKLYAKYILKCAAEGAVLGGVLGLALVGALCITAGVIAESLEEETE